MGGNTTDLLLQAGEAQGDGDYIQALRCAGEFARIAPAEDYARVKLAVILSQMAEEQGRILKDWNLVERAYAACGQVARMLLNRGQLLWAVTAARAALDIAPNDEEIMRVLTDDSGPAYREIAAELGISEAAVKKAVSRMRARFCELLRAEMRETLKDPAAVEEEIRYLVTALAPGQL